MIWFISDLHLGHENIIKYSRHQFENIAQMNETIIRNINEVVAEDDELWILGDFSYKCDKRSSIAFCHRIKCKNVHLVVGNHDHEYTKEDCVFDTITRCHVLKTEYGEVILCHYPFMEWEHSHRGSIHLHGHIHSTGEYNRSNLSKKYNDRFPDGHHSRNLDLRLRIYDVGVDANNFYPISLEEIASLMGLK